VSQPDLVSSIPGIAWPAIPDAEAQPLLAALFQLDQTQWWPAETIREFQFRQLKLLMSQARRNVPYYKERLRAAGFNPREAITPESWRELPILRRQDIQAAGTRLHARKLPRRHGKAWSVTTAGSTGRPIQVLKTQLTNFLAGVFTMRENFWQGRDLSLKLATIGNTRVVGEAPYPEGSILANEKRAASLLYALGPSVGLDVNCAMEQQVAWLERHRPAYLKTYPTNALRLARHCLDKGLELPGLLEVQVFSEIVDPELREVCREAWGAPVVDQYISHDSGYMALQCPDHDHYHIQAEGVLLEVLDQEGQPAQPGSIGRVVVTPLHNFAMPLIRYQIGDYAEVGEPCPCGRGLPTLKRIVGREQDLLTLPGGEKRWTSINQRLSTGFLEVAPITQFQIVQNRLEALEVRLAAERELTTDDEERLRQWLGQVFGYPFEVSFRYYDEIPRTPGGKFRDFISEIES
jgi:phenylacetate-CoA ligase